VGSTLVTSRTGWIGSLAGIIGSATIALASLITAIAYSGSNGEAYSPLNHWVSELGEMGVSQLALLFNFALIVGGALFVVFMVALAATRDGLLRYSYGAFGVVAGIGGLFVGVFPMNNLDLHGIAALTFFNLGWLAVGLASIDFLRQPDRRFPRWLVIIGGLTVAAFVAFLAVLLPLLSGDGLAAPDVRPDVWIVPILEWAVLIGILAWVFATGWTWLRAARAHG
jgi:hypothetical membrane protein